MPLVNANYVVSSVALGVEEYYAGVGEAPGVWSGRWAPALGLVGVVEADDLRALVDGLHPGTGESLLSGRGRETNAWDLTFSAPKSVSLAWAFGTPEVSAAAMRAHVEAVQVAMGLLEEKAAITRRQQGRVRRWVGTEGWAVAQFVHRTSRGGDPQLHTHCVVANLAARAGDGRIGAFEATAMHAWRFAAGAVYQNEVQRRLTQELGVGWGLDRSRTREMAGFEPGWVRAFSKRTESIEAELEATGDNDLENRALRAQADDEASLATRPGKDHSLTPTALLGRWEAEAAVVGMPTGENLTEAMRVRGAEAAARPSRDVLLAGLVDATSGLCANEPRFGEAAVIAHLAAASAGRFTTEEVLEEARAFLASEHVVRLTPKDVERSVPQWSTAAHRALEDRVLAHLDRLQTRVEAAIPAPAVEAALAASPHLAEDQVDAARLLCESGRALSVVMAPAGYGKTSMVYTAATAATKAGMQVLGVATTAKAAAELTGAGIPAVTIARLRTDLEHEPMPPGTVLVLDEVSQTSTLDAETVLTAVHACPGGRLWVLGDARQGRSVLAGGLAHELQHRADAGLVASAALTTNRRQYDAGDRYALQALRDGDVPTSVEVRTGHGWEHTGDNPEAVREELADAFSADVAVHGTRDVVALTVSHGDAEDLADRIRPLLAADGQLNGAELTGPGWTADRTYQAGDRILLHARCGDRTSTLINGTTATVTAVTDRGLAVVPDHGPGEPVLLPAGWVQGTRRDGSPNLSHAWARTIDGAQGGTWEQAHLLGTAALDTYRGYVGQSRSRQPTHTWNTTPLGERPDPAGVEPARNEPELQVAAALHREPDATFAATDDPLVHARMIVDELEQHLAVLATRPDIKSGQVDKAQRAVSKAEVRQVQAAERVAAAEARLEDASGLRRLTSAGRDRYKRANGDALIARDRLHLDTKRLAEAEAALIDVEHRAASASGWDAEHGWRAERAGELRGALADHWADAVLAAARQGDPLAYGRAVLRAATGRLLSRYSQTISDPEARQDVRDAIRADRDLLTEALAEADRPSPWAEAVALRARERSLERGMSIER